MDIHYKKNKNSDLFQELADEKLVNMDSIQNYIPIYKRFFNLNETNYNSINLNNDYKLDSIKEKIGYSIFNGTIVDNSDNITDKKIFIKFSPLIDPVKFMIGKYDNCYNILDLPKFENNNILGKILDSNNSAYSDGFFSFLSSLLLNKHNFINGIDYYGSFLGIKNNFTVDVEDDLEYLDDAEFFHEKNNVLFRIEETKNYKNLFSNTKKCKLALIIDDTNMTEEECGISNLNIDDDKDKDANIDIDIETYDDKSECNLRETNLEVEYVKDETVNDINKRKVKTNEQNESSSSCSSRYSNTDSSKNNDSDSEYDDDSDDSDDESDASSDDDTDEELLATIFKFPVQAIALECCDDTLDSYISNNNKIKDNEWESIILQIVLSLITYQKAFNFTHNDLHTNNVVYTTTEKKFLYYKYDNKHYKVPTYGKIYKIIDFGRAIYTFKGNLICSDSYAYEGDAYTQYNTEPYLNENKPRIEPNYSFDLCRLGCSLFDYLIEDTSDIKYLCPIKKLMVEWVYDNSNKNILYKNNGAERYLDFKLYKMIARTVNKHTPQNVIKKTLFEKYVLPKKKINNQTAIFNIDTLPIMT